MRRVTGFDPERRILERPHRVALSEVLADQEAWEQQQAEATMDVTPLGEEGIFVIKGLQLLGPIDRAHLRQAAGLIEIDYDTQASLMDRMKQAGNRMAEVLFNKQ